MANTNESWVSQPLIQFGFRPNWKKMSRPIKKELMKKLGEKNYNNIHDPRFYQDLQTNWETSKESFFNHAVEMNKVECSVCMETSDFGGKVTTLMCGHKFCTQCMLSHMLHSGVEACCPLCRGSVFNYSVPVENNTVERFIRDTENNMALERKREKRRLERMRKRSRNRASKQSS
jgi:hypothetical protein